MIVLVIVLVFAAAGIGPMVMARRTPARARAQQERKARHPGQYSVRLRRGLLVIPFPGTAQAP